MQYDALGFLGTGQMATAIAAGVTQAGLLGPSQLQFCDPNATQLQKAAERFTGCGTTTEAAELFGGCELVFLSVKPQVLRKIASRIREMLRPEHVLVSIAAGIDLESLRSWFGTDRIIRVMPNTPAQVGCGASAVATLLAADSPEVAAVHEIFASIGEVVSVDDDAMDAVTGLSGSGPAFVLLMIEAMIDAGVAAGLARGTATALAVQTVRGTAEMVRQSGLHPAVLRDQVTSPAGTTIAGLRALEASGFRSSAIEAVLTATRRSAELRSK